MKKERIEKEWGVAETKKERMGSSRDKKERIEKEKSCRDEERKNKERKS